MTGLASFSAAAINIDNGKDGVVSNGLGITIDAGDIIIDSRTNPEKVECIPQDNFNLTIPQCGITITVEVDYDVICHEWFDEATIKICLLGTDIHRTKTFDDNQKGKITFDFTLYPKKGIRVVLSAQYTDKTFWGEIVTDIKAEKNSYGGESTLLKPKQSAGGIHIYPNGDVTHYEVNPDPETPWYIGDDYPSIGTYVRIFVTYNNEVHLTYPITIDVYFHDSPDSKETIVIKNPAKGSISTMCFVEPGSVFRISFRFRVYLEQSGGYEDINGRSYWEVRDHRAPTIKFGVTDPWNGRVKAGEKLTQCVVPHDKDRDDMYYKVDWGDGTDSGWIYHDSYTYPVYVDHIYKKSGNYIMKATVKDEFGLTCEKDATKAITVSRSRSTSIPNARILESLDQFPILQQLFILLN